MPNCPLTALISDNFLLEMRYHLSRTWTRDLTPKNHTRNTGNYILTSLPKEITVPRLFWELPSKPDTMIVINQSTVYSELIASPMEIETDYVFPFSLNKSKFGCVFMEKTHLLISA